MVKVKMSKAPNYFQRYRNRNLFLSCTLQLLRWRDLDPMTLKLIRDLDIMKTYFHTKYEVAR